MEEELRRVIDAFINERRDAKLEAIRDGLNNLEAGPSKQRDKLEAQLAKVEARFERRTWLQAQAKSAASFRRVTHALRFDVPVARPDEFIAFRAPLQQPAAPGLTGSHSLASIEDDTVVSNAADLPVLKFLGLGLGERSLLELALARDATFLKVLDEDDREASSLCDSFASIVDAQPVAASHPNAKQLYFPLENGAYHLLAPLFPASFCHHIHRDIGEHHWGELAVEAKAAHRQGKPYRTGYRVYSNTAVRKVGGTQPQNVSVLNKKRGGRNTLLPSCPPNWRSPDVHPPFGVQSVFDGPFGRQPQVRSLTRQLRSFLLRVGHNNLAIRQRRARLVERICDEGLAYAERLKELDPGWSADVRCKLHETERLWLDPRRARNDQEFRTERTAGPWRAELSHRFGNWLNGALRSKKLALGDDEHLEWKRVLKRELELFKELLEDDRA